MFINDKFIKITSCILLLFGINLTIKIAQKRLKKTSLVNLTNEYSANKDKLAKVEPSKKNQG